ncbi:MAG: imidazole glycerol phosphate synthase subunit HisH [Pseudomonadota bacterium]
MQTTALIDYGSGNVHSARRALLEAARQGEREVEVVLTGDPAVIVSADRIVLPGVGHFAQCRGALADKAGVIDALEEAVLDRATPFLGICVGMQLLADFSLEDGDARGLGWLHGAVQPIEPGPGLPVPHMGWNALIPQGRHPVLADLGPRPHAYFVHSFAMSPENARHIAALAEYGRPLVAAVANGPIFGTQFHPEKSQSVGLKILSNFLRWAP